MRWRRGAGGAELIPQTIAITTGGEKITTETCTHIHIVNTLSHTITYK